MSNVCTAYVSTFLKLIIVIIDNHHTLTVYFCTYEKPCQGPYVSFCILAILVTLDIYIIP